MVLYTSPTNTQQSYPIATKYEVMFCSTSNDQIGSAPCPKFMYTIAVLYAKKINHQLKCNKLKRKELQMVTKLQVTT